MAKQARSPIPSGNSPRLEAVQSLGFIVAICLCLALSVGFLTGAGQRQTRPPSVRPDERINPNEAPTASLARLPGIGPTRARAIVAFRELHREQGGDGPVFRRADDLQQVKGIGPTTVEGIRSLLWFEPLREEAGESAGR